MSDEAEHGKETVFQHKTLAAAFCAAQGEFVPVAKDAKNPFFKSEYATLKALIDMVRPILKRHGLGYSQSVDMKEEKTTTTIIHESGETRECICPFSCADKKPQGYGSAITYFRRYALQAAFGIVVCDGSDDDGNCANGNYVVNKPIAASMPPAPVRR